MDILITGSSGFLGKEVCLSLKNDDTIFELSKLHSVHSIRLDKNMPAFSQAFDMVLHIAGKAHTVERNPNIINSFYNVNVLGTQNLINNFIKKKKIKFYQNSQYPLKLIGHF